MMSKTQNIAEHAKLVADDRCFQLRKKSVTDIEQFVLCCSCITGPKGSAAACVCVAGYEGNGTYCKGRNAQTDTHTYTGPVQIYNLISSLCQSWICAAGITVDVQSLLSAQRCQQEREPVRVKRDTLEMGSSAWVCSSDS